MAKLRARNAPIAIWILRIRLCGSRNFETWVVLTKRRIVSFAGRLSIVSTVAVLSGELKSTWLGSSYVYIEILSGFHLI